MKLSPLAPRPRILVSVLFFYREELAEEFVNRITPQLQYATEALGARIHLHLTLNYPNPGPIWDKLERNAKGGADSQPTIAIARPGWNMGFGAGHNLALQAWPADIVVVINSDLFCTTEDWLVRTVRAFDDQAVAIVGASENASRLREDGCGVPVSPLHPAHDFIDGSILAIRADATARLGLFSADFPFFYFEDSDLCLRFKQAGLAIAAISIPHEHLRYGSSRSLPRYLVSAVLDENRDRFFRKWGAFLESRKLVNRIAIDLSSADGDRLIASIPTIIALRREHPGAEIMVIHSPQADLSLLNADGIITTDKVCSEPVDRAICWPSDEELPDAPPALQLARAAGVELDHNEVSRKLRIWVRASLPSPIGASTSRPKPKALIYLRASQRKFDGQVPESALFTPTVERLETLGFCVEGIADDAADPSVAWFRAGRSLFQNPVQDLARARLILDASLVLAPHSGVLQLAQLLGVRAFGVFGAIPAFRSVFAWMSTGVFYAPQLSCVGCSARLGTPERNFCLRRDIACMSRSLGDDLSGAVEKFIVTGQSDLRHILSIQQLMYSRPKRPAPDLDLSAWPAD